MTRRLAALGATLVAVGTIASAGAEIVHTFTRQERQAEERLELVVGALAQELGRCRTELAKETP